MTSKIFSSFRLCLAVAAIVLVSGTFSLTLFSSPAFGQSSYHTVTFAENDSPTDEVVATQTEDAPMDLAAFSSLGFTDPGHTFAHWNTEPDGSGTSYSDGESYDFGSALTLYAIWNSPYVTVTFAENDTSSDSKVASQTENAMTGLTPFANLSPAFSNPGFTFAGWNTESDGGGTSYADGANYSFLVPLVLYAQWTASPSVTITFDGNGGTNSTSPIVQAEGSTLILPTASTTTRTDFVLSGWNTSANGSGAEYPPGASVTITAGETFYAQWTETSPLQVTFSDNGGSGVEPALSGELGDVVQLPEASDTLTNSGYTLTSWNTEPDGSGTSYQLGQEVTLSEPLTLYAQWTANTVVTISFAAQGGSGVLSPMSGAAGTQVTLPSGTSVVRAGYKLSSWNTASNGSGTAYTPGQTLNLTSNLTLYAQWKHVAVSALYGEVGAFSGHSVALTANLERQIRALATVVKTKGYTKVALFGYSAETGTRALDVSLSVERVNRVAAYLRTRLRALHDMGVTITRAGEGSVNRSANPSNSRVEVFVS